MASNADPLASLKADLDADLKRLGIETEDETIQTQETKEPDWKAESESLKTQLNDLRSLIESQSRHTRTVGAEGDAPTHTQPQNDVQPNNQFTKREFKVDQWAELAQRNPGKATLEAINAELGLPEGSNPFALFGVVGQQIQGLKTELENERKRSNEDRLVSAAQTFVDTHPEYEANQENYETLQGYLKQYGLPPTAAGWHLAYTAAINDGAVEPKKTRNRGRGQEEGEGEATQRTESKGPRLPSIKQGATQGEEDISSILEKLDRLPTNEVGRYLDRIARR